MNDILGNLVFTGSFIPHGHCYLWKPSLVWLHGVSDGLTAFAYYSIPLTLFYFVRKRRDLPFSGIFLLFATFIVSCGTTHVLDIWTLWYPTYWLSGFVKALTAIVSLITATKLVMLVPLALALPSPAQLEHTNQELHTQIQQRLQTEAELRRSQNQLEQRVQERTAELLQANQYLQKEISDRNAAEVELRRREERFSTLFNGMEDWILVYHLTADYYPGQLIEVNEQACQRLGYSRQELLKMSVTDIIGSTRIAPQASINRLLEERHIVVESVHCTKAKQQIPVEVSATLFTLNERPTVQAICRDITDRKRTEAEREQILEREQFARAQAESANRIKDEFLAVLSHELRTPLNPILGWTRLLQNGSLDSEKTAFALETIERNAKLQAQLIEDLLDISGILQGKLSLKVGVVDLATTIEAARETVRLAAEAKSIALHTDLEPVVCHIVGDANRLQQVVWNLLSNAVKFTPAQGEVHVTLEYGATEAQIIVKDTGKGISPDFLPFVFDTFRQADGTTTRKFGGLGLGLAIVRQIVELHGGSVFAESLGEGTGATFTVRLPLQAAIRPTSPNPQHSELLPESLTLHNVQILVVDDEQDTRELLTFLLEHQGASVTAVASAAEALASLRQLRPDLLLSDIGMPDMDGYELMQQLRALQPEQGGDIPAIALTAYVGEHDQQQSLKAGFQRHIAKPVQPDVLVKAIASLIRELK
ncbi:MAG: response regulator [Oscillatoriophycideae cyanobacterium NC_groundwater_1537_Pr4_S-0.65um_50_18]|nr:response regulator [Oscillatoriophycideae cyanobacterium NC_groundwater_1537_Pr4_S-0.65um_50_18]